MFSSLLSTLSPRSSSRGAQSPHQNVATDTRSLIEWRDAVQTSGANDLVLFDGKGVSTVGATPRSPMSPAALWRSHKASDARTLIANRFARALPTALGRDQSAIPFNYLTDVGAVRVHQLRLLVAMATFQRDLVTGGMGERQAAELSLLAFTPATWNCSDTQGLYNRINTCLIRSNQKIVQACLAASRRDDPPKGDVAWRNELETAGGMITQRRRSLAPPPDPAPAASSEPSLLPRPAPGADPDPEALQARRRSGDDCKSSRRGSDSDWVDASELRRADGEALPPYVNRSLAEAFSGSVSPLPTMALAARGALPNLASTEALSLADQLSLIPMYGSPSAVPSASGRPAHLGDSERSEAKRALLADTKGHLLGLSSPEHPTHIADLPDWGRRLTDAGPYRGLADPSGRQGAVNPRQAEIQTRWHRDLLPALQGLHERVTRALGQPLSNPFRDELLRWPLSARASLLRCSADSLQSCDPRGAGWAPRYRFHAELARALTTEECYTEQERQLQARVLGAVQTQAQARKQGVPNFQSVVAAVRAIFTQASQGRASVYQGFPSFELRMDSLNRQQASYNPFTRTVLIGPRALHEQSPMPYVLRHVAAASMHFYNHRLIDALALNEPHSDNTDWQIGSMLHALEQVPITAPALKNAGLQPEQANLLVLHTLPKQRELSFARAVSDAWESAKRDTLARSLTQGGGRQGVGTIAHGPSSVIPASVMPTIAVASEPRALAPNVRIAPTALASAASTASRVVTEQGQEDTGEGLGVDS